MHNTLQHIRVTFSKLTEQRTCNTPQHTATHRNTEQHKCVTSCTSTQQSSVRCNSLQHAATHLHNVLQANRVANPHHTPARCNTPQHVCVSSYKSTEPADIRITLQHTTAHSSTLQHAATRMCVVLQVNRAADIRIDLRVRLAAELREGILVSIYKCDQLRVHKGIRQRKQRVNWRENARREVLLCERPVDLGALLFIHGGCAVIGDFDVAEVHTRNVSVLLCVAVCCSVLQSVAECCSALLCVAACCAVTNDFDVTEVCVRGQQRLLT